MAQDDLLEGRSPPTLASADEGEWLASGTRERAHDPVPPHPSVGDLKVFEEIADPTVQDEPTAGKDDDPLCHRFDIVDEMRGQHDRPPSLGWTTGEYPEDHSPGDWVEARQRLVEKDETGRAGEREGEGDEGLLAHRAFPDRSGRIQSDGLGDRYCGCSIERRP